MTIVLIQLDRHGSPCCSPRRTMAEQTGSNDRFKRRRLLLRQLLINRSDRVLSRLRAVPRIITSYCDNLFGDYTRIEREMETDNDRQGDERCVSTNVILGLYF